MQGFYNLPINRKQLVALLVSQLVSLLGLGVGTRFIVTSGLHTQLVNQAKSELAVTEVNYNIKINQMGFGFRGQSDNPAIIAAAKAHAAGQLPTNLRWQVKKILQNEIKARTIEYATLVGRDSRIIINANANRTGEIFNPNNLVQEVFTDPRQIKASAIVSWAELVKENPPLPTGFAKQDALIRYTVTPVKDPVTKTVIGALISGDIVNGKQPIVKETLKAFKGGYSAIYLHKPTGEFTLATALDQGQGTNLDQAQLNVAFPNSSLLSSAESADGKTVSERIKVGEQSYTVAVRTLPNLFKEGASGPFPATNQAEPVAILVRGTPENALNEILARSLVEELAVVLFALIVIGFWVIILRQAVVKPVKQLRQTAKDFSQGDRQVRAEVFADDEIGQLAMTFNQMADSINTSTAAIEKQAQQRQAEADSQRREKERLQKGVIKLLLDIEGAQRGDLTVRATLDEGEMGSVADAFNATIHSLRQLVTQVQTVANQVHESAFDNESSVQKLSQEAITQAKVVAEALSSVAEMGQSIQLVAGSAQEAAAIARRALVEAQDGGETMEQTVSSIENIRSSVSETSKKVKRLAESSQEISKIVSIISGISEKTNLLAFNASIEAARAGEHGQGFRVVADEVRRLAERVTDSTKEIEQLVVAIQQETAEVLQTMEASTSQVVTGTQLVSKTKQTLQRLALISQQIDHLLQSISTSTVSQAQASQIINQTMQEIAAIAQTTSSESETVSSSLQELVGVAKELQSSVSQFQVEK